MNKVILGLILSVCVLGMALIMLNEKLNRKPDNDPKPVTEITEQTIVDDSKKETIADSQPDKPEKTRSEKNRPAPTPVTAKQNPATLEKTAPKTVPSGAEKHAKPVQQAVDKPAKPALAELEVPALPPVIDLSPGKPSLMEPAPMRNQEEANPVNTNDKPVAKVENLPDQAKKEIVAPDNRNKNAGTEKSNTSGSVAKKVAPAQVERNITKFVVLARDKGATVRLVGSSSLRQYKMNTLSNPDRLVVDLDGKWEVKAPGIPKNQIVGNIRLGKYDNYTKVVIDLKTKPKNTKIIFNNENKTMDIRLDQ